MRKSPLRVFVGVVTMALLGIAMTKGYEVHQVSSAKALTSENWGLGFSTEGEAPTANATAEELKEKAGTADFEKAFVSIVKEGEV